MNFSKQFWNIQTFKTSDFEKQNFLKTILKIWKTFKRISNLELSRTSQTNLKNSKITNFEIKDFSNNLKNQNIFKNRFWKTQNIFKLWNSLNFPKSNFEKLKILKFISNFEFSRTLSNKFEKVQNSQILKLRTFQNNFENPNFKIISNLKTFKFSNTFEKY